MFMMALAVVPLMVVWLDDRRRARESRRLAALRREAALQAMLLRQAVTASDKGRAVQVPNA
jgi:hypothetical protein